MNYRSINKLAQFLTQHPMGKLSDPKSHFRNFHILFHLQERSHLATQHLLTLLTYSPQTLKANLSQLCRKKINNLLRLEEERDEAKKKFTTH